MPRAKMLVEDVQSPGFPIRVKWFAARASHRQIATQ
jgi:hypothetical protein